MEVKFPFDGKSIKQILDESIRDSKPLENVQLEFKPFWESRRFYDEKKKDFKKNLDTGKHELEKPKHIKQINLHELAGLANTEGGVMLIGVEDDGKLVENQQPAYKLQSTIVNHIDACFGKLDAGGFRVKHEELESKNGKKVTVFRIDVSASENLLFVDGKLFKRHGEKTERLNAKEAIELEKRKRKENKMLEKEFHDGVPESVKTEYKEISDKFDKGNYEDSISHLYRLMREVMQKKYDKLDWKFKYSKILPGVLGTVLYNCVLFATLIGSLAYFLRTDIVYDITFPFLLGSIFFALLMATLYARDERKWLLQRVTPGGIPIIFSMWRMHPPSSICLTLLWCIVTRQKKIEIEILVWALIWFECFNGPSEDTYQGVAEPQHHGESYGNVIFELASTDEAIRINNIKPREAVMQYLLQNSMLMLNSLYSPELSEVQMP
jgi:hypothetical protein